jgi:hypothetical protein
MIRTIAHRVWRAQSVYPSLRIYFSLTRRYGVLPTMEIRCAKKAPLLAQAEIQKVDLVLHFTGVNVNVMYAIFWFWLCSEWDIEYTICICNPDSDL